MNDTKDLPKRTKYYSCFQWWPTVDGRKNGKRYTRRAWPHEIIHGWIVQWEANKWAKEINAGIAECEKAWALRKNVQEYRDWLNARSKARGVVVPTDEPQNKGGL